MPKDWPEFKSWKKPKRKKLAKVSANRWGRVNKSGDLCNGCRVEISWESKKGPRSPRHSYLFTATTKERVKGIPFWFSCYTYQKVFCRRCYEKEIKRMLVIWAKFFTFIVILGVLLFLVDKFLIKK